MIKIKDFLNRKVTISIQKMALYLLIYVLIRIFLIYGINDRENIDFLRRNIKESEKKIKELEHLNKIDAIKIDSLKTISKKRQDTIKRVDTLILYVQDKNTKLKDDYNKIKNSDIDTNINKLVKFFDKY